MHEIFSENISGHLYRGYVVLNKENEVEKRHKVGKFFNELFRQHSRVLNFFLSFLVLYRRKTTDMVYLFWNGISMAIYGEIFNENSNIC